MINHYPQKTTINYYFKKNVLYLKNLYLCIVKLKQIILRNRQLNKV